ncbi:MAG: hypothetical protein LBK56_10805 [Gracilibacteraceae bacterium]|nr:hypothetical protein [Gracilibacteraceae bacterium]
MIYLWEAILAAAERGMSLSELEFIPASAVSPYTEVVLPDINGEPAPGVPIEINPYFRFSQVFSALLAGGLPAKRPEFFAALFDMMLHVLGWIDIRSGMSRAEIEKMLLREQLERGDFGKCGRNFTSLFCKRERDIVLTGLRSVCRMGMSLALFTAVLKQVYPYAGCYLDVEEERRLLVYLACPQDKTEEKRIDFLRAAFVPLDIRVTVFWQRHFGIIDVGETMEIGEIMSYN